jgi:ferric-dicitrate binding protein FerR (iron transport regulator)
MTHARVGVQYNAGDVLEGPVHRVSPAECWQPTSASKPENTHPQPLPSKKNGSAQREVAAAGEGPLFLTANQQVTVQRSGSAEPVREVDSQRELAWAEGRLIFHNDDVGKVIAQFNRYNRVQLSVTDPALASRPVSGVFNASEPEAFIAFLQTVVPVDIARDHDKSITIGSPRPR